MYGKELRCLNTKGKYGKVTNTEIKWSIISKSVMMIIFVEFIDQFIHYPINHASLNNFWRQFYQKQLVLLQQNPPQISNLFIRLSQYIYSVAPIHRGPLFREIQYIANRPWLPKFP